MSKPTYEELEAEVTRLRGELRFVHEVGSMGGPLLDRMRALSLEVEQSKADAEKWRQRATDCEQACTETQRHDALETGLIAPLSEAIRHNPRGTYVAALLLGVSARTGYHVEAVATKPIEYPGSFDQAENELLPQFIFALTRRPWRSDLRNQTLDGISTGELWRAVANVLSLRDDRELMEQQRVKEFEDIWKYLERKYPNEYSKTAVSDKFTKIVRGTEKHMIDRLNEMHIETEARKKFS